MDYSKGLLNNLSALNLQFSHQGSCGHFAPNSPMVASSLRLKGKVPTKFHYFSELLSNSPLHTLQPQWLPPYSLTMEHPWYIRSYKLLYLLHLRIDMLWDIPLDLQVKFHFLRPALLNPHVPMPFKPPIPFPSLMFSL